MRDPIESNDVPFETPMICPFFYNTRISLDIQ